MVAAGPLLPARPRPVIDRFAIPCPPLLVARLPVAKDAADALLTEATLRVKIALAICQAPSARVGLLGSHDRDRQAERLDAMGEVAAEPVRDAGRKRGDDDLVESTAVDRLLHGDGRIAVADCSVDVRTCGLVEQRKGELEHRRGLVGLRVPVGARHQQGEAAGGAARTRAHLVEQPRSRRGSVSHHQYARGRCGCHPAGLGALCLRSYAFLVGSAEYSAPTAGV